MPQAMYHKVPGPRLFASFENSLQLHVDYDALLYADG